MSTTIDISGSGLVPINANSDERGCLYEIFRQSWPGAFPAVQWNSCVSEAQVVRGVHLHPDYDEFYTLTTGSVMVGLIDVRDDSPTFGNSAQFLWTAKDEVAVTIPRGVAHVLRFNEDSVLVFGLSDYWHAEANTLGCRWDDPELGLEWDLDSPVLSDRDANAGSFGEMVANYRAEVERIDSDTSS